MRRRSILLGAVGVALAPLARAQDRGPDDRTPADPAELSREERRHVPVLLLPRAVRAGRPFDLVVQIGVEPHVMTEAHHIEWVEVRVGSERAFRVELSAQVAFPIVRVPLVLREPTELLVRAGCNLHGTWRTRRDVPVT